MEWKFLLVMRCFLLLLGLSLFPAEQAEARDAEKSIRLSVVFAPGGALDTAARVLALEAEKILGQDIVVQNVPSGGGMMGVARLAKARADGSQLAACVSSALVYLPHRGKVPYHPLRDVEPLLIFGQASPVLVTRPDAPWTDLRTFLDAVRKRGGTMRIGVPGIGTPSHIALAMMTARDPSLKWRFIPFGGPGEAEAALLGGHVDVAASGALPRMMNGQLRPLMVLSGLSLPALPAIPTLSDAGFADPGKGDSAFVLLTPAGTPEGTMLRLEDAFIQAARSEVFRNALEKSSVAPLLLGKAQSKAFLKEAWRNEHSILKAAGITDVRPVAAPETKGTPASH